MAGNLHSSSKLGSDMAESTTPESARATLADRVRNLAYLYQPDDPFTLASGIASGRIKRGDRVVLCGTSAGMSFGGILLQTAKQQNHHRDLAV